MYTTSKISACLVLSCLGLMLVSSNSVWPQDVRKTSPKIKDLKAKRLEVLGQAFIEAKEDLVKARIRQPRALSVSAKYFAARREQAESQEEQIKVIEEEVQEAEKLLEFAKKMKALARETLLGELLSQTYVLDAQIALEIAKADK